MTLCFMIPYPVGIKQAHDIICIGVLTCSLHTTVHAILSFNIIVSNIQSEYRNQLKTNY